MSCSPLHLEHTYEKSASCAFSLSCALFAPVTTRLADALACYSSAVTTGALSGQQRCRVDLALCTVAAKQAKKVRTSGPLSGEREEAACISSLLVRAGDDCSASDTATAHVTVGVFRLSEEWDTGGALRHFLAATAQHKDFSMEGEGKTQDGAMVQGDGFEWGAVWLAQVSVHIRYSVRDA